MRLHRLSRLHLAWMASIAAYAGFWAYHAAAYGLWYHGPEPLWLFTGLTVSLLTALVITFIVWRRMVKARLR